ncbi:MAG TPA: alpha/beta hydrolase [Sedimentisphaerales bacterium]|nr:alpha/beta hydrolase [Sedimentisphaerales bacterium]
MKTCKILTGVLGALLCTGIGMTASPVFAAERQLTPERLEKLLKRYPEADADNDGKLMADEARAYIRKLRSGRSGDVPTAWQATDGKRRRVSAKRAESAGGLADLKPDHADLSYGPHPNNKLDLWLATSRQPTPLVVFIHGGGFVGGDKSSISSLALRQCLDAGASLAAINYRFRTELPIQDVLRDCARAIQFLRWKAEEFNFDKTRVAAFGGSAGAGTSLWLAFHDDLADPENPDPVLRESSRLSAAGATACQATYDVLQWPDVLGDETVMRFSKESDWPSFYGLKSQDEMYGPVGKKIRADVDMLGLITKDDAPVFLASSNRHDSLQSKGNVNHSPKHAIAIKKRCDEVGVPATLKISGSMAGDALKQTPVEFLIGHLEAQTRNQKENGVAANFDMAA